jgi:hypothetical protein
LGVSQPLEVDPLPICPQEPIAQDHKCQHGHEEADFVLTHLGQG